MFAAAAGISVVGFLLTWLLREVPLRKSAQADGISEAFAMPREAESLPELQRIVSSLAQHENSWRVYRELADRADVELDPAELWLIARLGEGTQVAVDLPGRERGVHLPARAWPRRRPGSHSRKASASTRGVVDARREALGELLDGWDTGERQDVQAMLDELARELVAQIPA